MNAKEYIRNQPCPVVTAPESPDATRASGDVRDCLKRWLFRCRPNVFSDRLSSRSSIQWVHRRWSCAGRLASALLAARHIQSIQIAVKNVLEHSPLVCIVSYIGRCDATDTFSTQIKNYKIKRMRIICFHGFAVAHCSVIGVLFLYKKIYRWLHSAPHVKRETRILPIRGRCL